MRSSRLRRSSAKPGEHSEKEKYRLAWWQSRCGSQFLKRKSEVVFSALGFHVRCTLVMGLAPPVKWTRCGCFHVVSETAELLDQMQWTCKPFGYGSVPINTIFSGMNIHLPAILMWTTGVQGFDTLPDQLKLNIVSSNQTMFPPNLGLWPVAKFRTLQNEDPQHWWVPVVPNVNVWLMVSDVCLFHFLATNMGMIDNQLIVDVLEQRSLYYQLLAGCSIINYYHGIIEGINGRISTITCALMMVPVDFQVYSRNPATWHVVLWELNRVLLNSLLHHININLPSKSLLFLQDLIGFPKFFEATHVLFQSTKTHQADPREARPAEAPRVGGVSEKISTPVTTGRMIPQQVGVHGGLCVDLMGYFTNLIWFGCLMRMNHGIYIMDWYTDGFSGMYWDILGYIPTWYDIWIWMGCTPNMAASMPTWWSTLINH